MITLKITLQVLHLVCAAFWFGSYIWTELILWPRMRATGLLPQVQGNLRSVSGRQMNAVGNIGTIVFGYARGAAGGVFDRLTTPYGILFVLAAIFGTAMIIWWISMPTRDRKWSWRAYYSCFWIMLGLMVGMRFTA